MKKLFPLILVVSLLATLAIVPASAQDETTLVFWTSEVQPERIERQQNLIAAFEEANPGVNVEIVPTEENEQVQLMTVNLASGTVPDIVLHAAQFTAKWVNDGAINAEAATEVINNLGVDTFGEGALDLVAVEEGLYGAVPSDGWGQLLVYRSDLFEEAGLAPPDTYDAILEAAVTLNDPDNGFFGFCGANAADQQYTWQVLEHIALANGANLVNEEGNVVFDSPAMIEAFEFYKQLMDEGGQPESGWFWQQTRANYLNGNCGMTIWSPFILDEMAGLRDSAFPACAECEDNPAFIAENTDIIARITGFSGDTAAWGSTVNLGIGVNAPDAARDFVEFWFSEEFYLAALSVAPEGKFPMRQGTDENPELFVNGWRDLEVGVDRTASLSEFYDDDLDTVIEGSQNYNRMGFEQGQALLASAVGSQFFIQENLVAFLNGDISVEEAVENIQIEIEDLQIELES